MSGCKASADHQRHYLQQDNACIDGEAAGGDAGDSAMACGGW